MEHPKVQAGKNLSSTPLDDLTEKDLLLGIYRAVNTVRNILVVLFVLGILGAVVLLAQGPNN